MYEFSFDEASRVLTMRQWGFWTVDLVRPFFDEMSRKVDELEAKCGVAGVIVDNTNFPVQSNEVVALMSQLSAGELAKRAYRTAIVSSRALSNLQIKRVVGDEKVRIFGTMIDAKAWLAT